MFSKLNKLASNVPLETPTLPARDAPRRLKNTAYRGREHLTEAEVAALVAAAGKVGRYGARDAAAILLAYRHGLRVSELCGLRWDQVDFAGRRLVTMRAKGGISGTHPLTPDVAKVLKALAAARSPDCIHVLENERGGPLKPGAIRKLLTRAGRLAKLPLPVHPHMLRHACGFYLANKDGVSTRTIQEYLGHRSIASTERYTALAAGRFKGLWD